mgnify:FL=1|tara:strand:- start:225 stop:434 length:210 start_codon:yes stop_codon:yes gene_type:complete
MYYIDLNGPQGNAFSLMGTATKLGKSLGFEKDRIETIITEMRSGDYENLKKVFLKNFGEIVAFEEDYDE